MSDSPLVELQGVWFAYPEAEWALQDLNLQIHAGEYLAVIGPNGAGKTTLAKHLNGLLQPSQGAVRVLGHRTDEIPARELASVVGYVFQNPDHQIFAATTAEEVGFGPRNLGLDESLARERTEEAMARFGLSGLAETPPALLGFAVRRQVALAAVYAMRPRLLILDEPTGGLDADSLREVMSAVTQLQADGHAIVLITHDLRLVAEHAQRVICLSDGRLIADAPPRKLFRSTMHSGEESTNPPQITQLSQRLAAWSMPEVVLSVAEFVSAYVDARTQPGRTAGVSS